MRKVVAATSLILECRRVPTPSLAVAPVGQIAVWLWCCRRSNAPTTRSLRVAQLAQHEKRRLPLMLFSQDFEHAAISAAGLQYRRWAKIDAGATTGLVLASRDEGLSAKESITQPRRVQSMTTRPWLLVS
jgi:hypothetical protein